MERTNHQNNSTLEKLALDAFKSSSFLIVNKTLIKKLDPTGAIILSNYLDKYDYFKKTNPDNNGWFFLTYAQQTEQIEINEYTLSIWRKKLHELGILEIQRRGLPAKDWYNINFKNLIDFLYSEKRRTSPLMVEGDYTLNQRGGLIKETDNNKETDNKKEKKKNIIKKENIFGKLPTKENFDLFWRVYPKKSLQGKAKNAWNKLCDKQDIPLLKEIIAAIKEQTKTTQWQNPKFIPLASTWINQQRWLDDPEQMVAYEQEDKNTPKNLYIGNIDWNF